MTLPPYRKEVNDRTVTFTRRSYKRTLAGTPSVSHHTLSSSLYGVFVDVDMRPRISPSVRIQRQPMSLSGELQNFRDLIGAMFAFPSRHLRHPRRGRTPRVWCKVSLIPHPGTFALYQSRLSVARPTSYGRQGPRAWSYRMIAQRAVFRYARQGGPMFISGLALLGRRRPFHSSEADCMSPPSRVPILISPKISSVLSVSRRRCLARGRYSPF
jgi:hypothetical protein